jgi:putative ABC transport system substrate-binding protein
VRRRAFISLLGGTAAWPLAARAQEAGRSYWLGILIQSPRHAPATLALFDELRLNGFIEGQNLTVNPD